MKLKLVYNKKRTEKGIAFPVCLSVNEICGHYSPLFSDKVENQKIELCEGDVVKV